MYTLLLKSRADNKSMFLGQYHKFFTSQTFVPKAIQ